MKRVGTCSVKCVIQQRSHFLRLCSVGSLNTSIENWWQGNGMEGQSAKQKKSFGVMRFHGNMNRNES